jgi:DNA-binding response OmpR family regulator
MTRTLLVVEPSPSLGKHLTEKLDAKGWQFTLVQSADAALRMMNTKLDVLITEIELASELSGWQLAGSFRAYDPTIGIIYTSADMSSLEQRLPRGLFFPKPYNVLDVIDGCRLLFLEKDEFASRLH